MIWWYGLIEPHTLIRDNKLTNQGVNITVQRKNKTYTKEFKEEAVSLILDQGYSVSYAAVSLGVTTKLLYNWKQKLEAKNLGYYYLMMSVVSVCHALSVTIVVTFLKIIKETIYGHLHLRIPRKYR